MNFTFKLLTFVTLAAAFTAVVYFNWHTGNHGESVSVEAVEGENTEQSESPDTKREEEYKDDVTIFVRDEIPATESPQVATPPVSVPATEEPEEVTTEVEDEPEEEVTELTETLEEPLTSNWTPKTAEECATLISESQFFLDDDTVVLRREAMHRADGETETANLLREISCYPQAVWLTWQDANSMRQRVEQVIERASLVEKTPVFVIYNSPDYTSTKWWVGNQGEDYLEWIEKVAKGVADYEAWFIVEPDALGLSTDYSTEDLEYRLNELSQVVDILKMYAPNSRVYLDAGHNKWKTPEIFADLLTRAGIENADGFVLNISNYQALEDEIERGEALSRLTGDKHFIIDTSRNGVGAPIDNEWCNAFGRALGHVPTTDTGSELIDAFFWVKPPGESDGTCNGGPTPGQFWLEYALGLVKTAYQIP